MTGVPFAEAFRSVADSYRFHLSLRGALLRRLAYNTARWALYLGARYVWPRRDAMLASAAANRGLARLGVGAGLVSVVLPEGLELTVDMGTCQMIVKELWHDGIYWADPDFKPRAGDTVFDVGAQQGVYALLAAAAGAKVVCAEPEPRNLDLLRRNIERNKADCAVFPLAVSDGEGEATLFRSPDNPGGHSLQAGEGPAEPVKVARVTLATLARRAGCAPTLLKIDVEGSALAVLRGGLPVIERARPRIVLELDRDGDEERAAALLGPLGYSQRRIGNNLFARPA